MKGLFILNDPPYGSERSYNGFRHAVALASKPGCAVKVFLLGDAVISAKKGQKTPDGYYNMERMLKLAKNKVIVVGVCGSCMDARGITEEELVEPAKKSNMDQLAEWSMWADKVMTY